MQTTLAGNGIEGFMKAGKKMHAVKLVPESFLPDASLVPVSLCNGTRVLGGNLHKTVLPIALCKHCRHAMNDNPTMRAVL